MNLYGVPRSTFDLDIFIDWSRENVKKLKAMLSDLHFVPTPPIDIEDLILKEERDKLLAEKGMVALNFINKDDPLEEIDIITVESIPFKRLYGRKRAINIEDFEIYVLSMDDLIKVKKKAGRRKDKQDIDNLLKAKKILKDNEKKNNKNKA